MEMELMYSRAMDMNGASMAEDADGLDPTIYKQKYERVLKELEYTKKRLQQQHEDDLEQLMALKKQLEKKVKKKKSISSTAGLEPAIFRSVGGRVIRCATRPILLKWVEFRQ